VSSYYFIGSKELSIALSFTGVRGAAVENAEAAGEAFSRITASPGNVHILILQEEVSSWLKDEVSQWQLSGKYPLIVEIPGLNGHIEGRRTLVDSIREAIGVHV
jgi:V/A-type H+-transporting ATPase subunit F